MTKYVDDFVYRLLAIQVQSTAVPGVCDDPRVERCLQEGPQLTCSGLLPPAVELQVVTLEICNWPEIIFDPRLLNQNFQQLKNLTISGDPVVSEYLHIFRFSCGFFLRLIQFLQIMSSFFLLTRLCNNYVLTVSLIQCDGAV